MSALILDAAIEPEIIAYGIDEWIIPAIIMAVCLTLAIFLIIRAKKRNG